MFLWGKMMINIERQGAVVGYDNEQRILKKKE